MFRFEGLMVMENNSVHSKLNEGKPRFDLPERLLEFSARVIRAVSKFHNTFAGQHVAAQLIRSSTSPLANHAESQGASSSRDFVHKLRTCLQEMRESQRWLMLAHRVPLIEQPDELAPLIQESDELIRIFYSSIRTAGYSTASSLKEDSEAALDDFHLQISEATFEVQSSGFKVERSS